MVIKNMHVNIVKDIIQSLKAYFIKLLHSSQIKLN